MIKGDRLFLVVPTGMTRGNGHELKTMRFHMNTRKYLLNCAKFKGWHRLSREVVESLPVEIFKAQLDMVLGSHLQEAEEDWDFPVHLNGVCQKACSLRD